MRILARHCEPIGRANARSIERSNPSPPQKERLDCFVARAPRNDGWKSSLVWISSPPTFARPPCMKQAGCGGAEGGRPQGSPLQDRHDVGAPLVGALFDVIAGPKNQCLNLLVSVQERQRRSHPFFASLYAGLLREPIIGCACVRPSRRPCWWATRGGAICDTYDRCDGHGDGDDDDDDDARVAFLSALRRAPVSPRPHPSQ
jgi:hypothetical protein